MAKPECTGGRIMLVDDDAAIAMVLENILRLAGFSKILAIRDPLQVSEFFLSFGPDIILLDLSMPHRDGFGVMADLGYLLDPEDFVPIIVVTGDSSAATRQRALGMGAMDFISKPFDRLEVVLRVSNLLRMRQLHVVGAKENERLEAKVLERTAAIADKAVELEVAKMEILNRLALAAEFRDDDTGKHTQRVGEASARLALELGLSESEASRISLAAPLHDIGKIGIADAILLKPGKLEPEEFEIVKGHTTIGERLLGKSPYDVLNYAAVIAATHHESWDGSGYPRGLRGEEIPLAGQIVAVADVYDALTHKRSYKAAWPATAARDEVRRLSGTKFNPEIATAFLGSPALSVVG